MRQAAPELSELGAFLPEDIQAMEAAFDAACQRANVGPANASDRRQMALAIIFAFKGGERDRDRLVAAAIRSAAAAA